VIKFDHDFIGLTWLNPEVSRPELDSIRTEAIQRLQSPTLDNSPTSSHDKFLEDFTPLTTAPEMTELLTRTLAGCTAKEKERFAEHNIRAKVRSDADTLAATSEVSQSIDLIKFRRDNQSAFNQRAAALAVSSGPVLNAMAALGAALWTAFTTVSNKSRLFGGSRRPPPITTQS